MQNVLQIIRNLENQPLVRVGTCLLIIFAFWMLSSGIAFWLVKLVKVGEKNTKKIEKSSFYQPLKIFFRFLGLYIAIIFANNVVYKISNEIMQIINKGFKIITTIIFARGFALAFTENSSLVKQIKKKSTKNVDDAMLSTLLKIIRCIIYIIAGIIIVIQLEYNLNGLITGLGLGGVVITLAAQDTAKNLFGGVVIFIDKPFVVGDWIEVDKYEGTVEEITFRSTRIRTFENSVVNIPNSVMSDSSVTNWSKMEKRRYKTYLYLDINTPLDKVEQLMDKIRKVLLKHEQIEDDTILVKFEEIIDNGIEIMISSYTDSVDYVSYLQEREAINYKIMQIVRDEGIKLAENSQIVHLKT